MSWVTLDRICTEESRSDDEVRRLVARSNRPLRWDAAGLSDDELLEKLRGFSFGFGLDRGGLERLCEGALSAEEMAARRLIASRDFRTSSEEMQGDWIWICLVTLWQRWWPDRVCLELLDDKIQAGYRELGRDVAARAAWLDACSDVLRSNLRYSLASMHGNPWLRLLRQEAEDLVAVLA
jgi:hypothetical protein